MTMKPILAHFCGNVALEKHAAYMFMQKPLETKKVKSIGVIKYSWHKHWISSMYIQQRALAACILISLLVQFQHSTMEVFFVYSQLGKISSSLQPLCCITICCLKKALQCLPMALFVIASLLVCKGFFETQCNSGQRLQRFTFPKVVAERCKKLVNC